MIKSLFFLSLIGLIISGYLGYLYAFPEKLDSSKCNINSYLSCSTVGKSSYAYFLGIPVPAIGMFGFLVLTILSTRKVKYYSYFLFYLSLIFLIFMIRLTYLELFVIKAICIYCLIITLISVLSFIMVYKKYGQENIKEILNHIE